MMEIPDSQGALIRIRDTKLFVRSFGSPANPLILVVHGGPGGSHDKLLPLNAFGSDFHVVFYDQRGTGRSERLENLDEESARLRLNLDENVEDIEALRRYFGKEKIVLLGHSWGGALVTFYAAKYFDRVEKLIVYSGGPEDTELADAKERRHATKRSTEENRILAMKIKLLVEAVLENRSQVEIDRLFSEAVAIVYPSLYARPPVSISIPEQCGFWANRAAGAYVDSFDRAAFAGQLQAIPCPTLLVWGRHEPSPQERLLYLLDSVRDARFVIFEESGHNALEEEKENFLEVLGSFLRDSPISKPNFRSRNELVESR